MWKGGTGVMEEAVRFGGNAGDVTSGLGLGLRLGEAPPYSA